MAAKGNYTDLFEVTDLYTANLQSDKYITINQGGTYSGKTYSIMQVLFTEGLQNANEIITVCGETVPTLKAGALTDATNIIERSPMLSSLITDYNATDRVYTLFNKTKIEFKSYADWGRAKNGKRHRLFCNETNNIPEKICDELIMRTEKKVYLDYNPNAEFWVHEKTIHRPDVKFIRSWHNHNTFLTQIQHDRIENINDPGSWKVYARGLTGKLDGLIFRNWEEVDAMPPNAKFIGTGLDFGFTNDPTACIDVYMSDGGLYLDERVYGTNLTNTDISQQMAETGGSTRNIIIADSADPKSIEELHRLGWYIEGAKKGPDSIKTSIDILKRYKFFVTARSVNLKKELRAYKWRTTKEGKALNEPVDYLNHAIDAVRYVALNNMGMYLQTGDRLYSVY